MTATEARQNFFRLLETAVQPGMSVTITRDGHPQVVVMSADEFEGWQETLEIMADPALLRSIRAGMRERSTVSLEELTTSRHARPHGVQSRPQTKRGKRARKSA
jgi:antitoxin YefM